MPQHAERFGIAIGQQPQFDRLFDVGDFGERPGRVDDLAVGLGGQDRLGQARADGFGDVEAGAVVGNFLERAVRETHGDHAMGHSRVSGRSFAVTNGEPPGSGEFRYIVQRPIERQRTGGRASATGRPSVPLASQRSALGNWLTRSGGSRLISRM